jgi:hypothetical protein
MPYAAPAREMETVKSARRRPCPGGELAVHGMAVDHVDAPAAAEHSSHMGIVCDFLRDVTVIDNLGVTHPRTMFILVSASIP